MCGSMKKKSKKKMAYKDGGKVKGMMGGGMVKYGKGGAVKSKGMAKGGAVKSKGMAKGGRVKAKGMAKGGKVMSKGYANGGLIRRGDVRDNPKRGQTY